MTRREVKGAGDGRLAARVAPHQPGGTAPPRRQRERGCDADPGEPGGAAAGSGAACESVGAWLRQWTSDPDAAAVSLLLASQGAAALFARRSRLPPGDALSDAAAEAIVRTLADRCRAPSRADPATPLIAWLAGVVGVAYRDERRRAARAQRAALDRRLFAGSASGTEPVAPVERRVLDPAHLDALTPRQREAVLLALEGTSERQAARAAGIGRDAFRDRVRGAVAAIRRRLQPGNDGKAWARVLLEEPSCDLGHDAIELLRLCAAGRSVASIGAALGITTAAARDRMYRLRRRVTGKGAVRRSARRQDAPAP